mmetsp:Transcript_1443/g.3257  ORF Transcript_1443/g.3257 Transcript_1443/m.3257 type:complete len:936 (-) Transcript_1443:72-2879(-)
MPKKRAPIIGAYVGPIRQPDQPKSPSPRPTRTPRTPRTHHLEPIVPQVVEPVEMNDLKPLSPIPPKRNSVPNISVKTAVEMAFAEPVPAAPAIPEPVLPDPSVGVGMSLRQLLDADDCDYKNPGKHIFERFCNLFAQEYSVFPNKQNLFEMKLREASGNLGIKQPNEFQVAVCFYMLDRLAEFSVPLRNSLNMLRSEFLKAVYSNWEVIITTSDYMDGTAHFASLNKAANKFKFVAGKKAPGTAVAPLVPRGCISAAIDRAVSQWQYSVLHMALSHWRMSKSLFRKNKATVVIIIRSWGRYRQRLDIINAFGSWKSFAFRKTRHKAGASSGIATSAESLSINAIKQSSIYTQQERALRALEVQFKVMQDKVKRLQDIVDGTAETEKQQVEQLQKELAIERRATQIAFGNDPVDASRFKPKTSAESQEHVWDKWLLWQELGEEEILFAWVNECVVKGKELIPGYNINVVVNWNAPFQDSVLLLLILVVAGRVSINIPLFLEMEIWDRAVEMVVQFEQLEIVELLTPELIVNGAGDLMKCTVADLFCKISPVMDPTIGGPGAFGGEFASKNRMISLNKIEYKTATKDVKATADALRSTVWRIKRHMWRQIRLRASSKSALTAAELPAGYHQVRLETVRETVNQRQAYRLERFGSRAMASEKADVPETVKAEVETVLRSFATDLKRVFEYYQSRDAAQYGVSGMSALGFRLFVKECHLNRGACTLEHLEDTAVAVCHGAGKQASLSPALVIDLLLRVCLLLHPPDDQNSNLVTVPVTLGKVLTMDIIPRFGGKGPIPMFVQLAFHGECRQALQENIKSFQLAYAQMPLNGTAPTVAANFGERRDVDLVACLRSWGVEVEQALSATVISIAKQCASVGTNPPEDSDGTGRIVTMTFAGFVEALCAVATLMNPSPFVPLHEKVLGLVQVLPKPESLGGGR